MNREDYADRLKYTPGPSSPGFRALPFKKVYYMHPDGVEEWVGSIYMNKHGCYTFVMDIRMPDGHPFSIFNGIRGNLWLETYRGVISEFESRVVEGLLYRDVEVTPLPS